MNDLAANGVRQFLDIGTGLPTADNTHDVAQRVAPDSRIVYVDHDPLVINHARALLKSKPEGKTDYIQADLRDWDTIRAGAAQTLDFSRPVAVLIIAVLHFIPDQEDPHAIISRMVSALAPGSYLVIAHAASDIAAEVAAAMAQSYNAVSSLTITPRDRSQVTGFFDGLDLTDGGLLPLAQWWRDGDPVESKTGFSCYCGIGKKP